MLPNPVQMKYSTRVLSHKQAAVFCAAEYGANKSGGGEGLERSSQCGTHLCCLLIYAMYTFGAFVWAPSLNHASAATYNMRESVMQLLQSKKERKELYNWEKKLHFFDVSVEEHHWRPLPEAGTRIWQTCSTLNVSQIAQTMHKKN